MASRSASTVFRALARPSSVAKQTRAISSKPLVLLSQTRIAPQRPSFTIPSTTRLAHSIPRPPAPSSTTSSEPTAPNTKRPPHYELTFTCLPCGDRSAHKVSKQGYHHGSVLITCPKCRNRHVISDNLNIFGNRKITIEDLMRERGQLVKKGTLGEDGDIEFWEDGSTTSRADRQTVDPKVRQRNTAADNEDAPGSTWGKA